MQRWEIPLIPVRQLVLWTLGVTAVVGCFWLLIRFQNVVVLLLTAVILSTAVRPAAVWLEKRGVAKPIGILLIFTLVGLLLALLVWYTLPLLAEQGAAIAQSLGDGYQTLRQSLQRLPNILVRRLFVILPSELPTLPTTEGGAPISTDDSQLTLTDAFAGARPLFSGLFSVIALIILAFYWTLEGEHLKQAAFLLIPVKKRGDTRDLVQEIENKVSGYLLGQGLLCLIIGGLAFVAYALIGLPHVLLLAVFAGLLEAVPTVGPFLGAIPAIIVAFSISPLTALWVIVATAVIQQLENSFLVPRVMNRAIGVRPLVTLLALLAFGSLFGILGALIALPLASVIQLLLDRSLMSRESLEQKEPGRDRLSVLRYETNQLVQDVRNQVRHKEGVSSAATDELEDEVEAIAQDLEGFLAAQGADPL